MKHIGNLEITKENQDQFKDLVEVTGHLYISSNAKLEAPLLTTVGGYLYIYSNAKLDALTTVGGYLYIYSDAKLDALTTVGGNLSVNSNAKLDALTTVGGYLYINSDAKLDALTTVGGYLYINSDAKLDAKALTAVGGNLYIYSDAKLDAKALTAVGGNLTINSNAKLDAPKLKSKNSDEAKSKCKKALEKSLAKEGLILADGLLSWLISKKKSGDLTVYKIRIVGKEKPSFMVQRGDSYSHGETIKKATDDLRFKLSDRDVSKFKSLSKTKKHSVDDLIQAYRAITGACEQGVKEFCESIDMSKKYTIKEVVKLTNGKFGNDKFEEFYK